MKFLMKFSLHQLLQICCRFLDLFETLSKAQTWERKISSAVEPYNMAVI
jgi:hypothetical protein